MIAPVAALTFTALAAVLTLFHLAIVAGVPWGHLTMGGRWPGRLPPPARLLSALSAGLIGLMAWVILARADLTADPFPRWAIYAVLGYFTLAIPMHLATPSPPERTLWLPVIVIMLTAGLIVLLS